MTTLLYLSDRIAVDRLLRKPQNVDRSRAPGEQRRQRGGNCHTGSEEDRSPAVSGTESGGRVASVGGTFPEARFGRDARIGLGEWILGASRVLAHVRAVSNETHYCP